MKLSLRLAVATCRGWTRLYTRSLTPEACDARRAEIESDLWQQRAHALDAGETPVDTAFSIITRVVLGIPADLSWRRGELFARSPKTDRMNGDRTVLTKLFVWMATALAVFMGIFFGYIGIGRGADGEEAVALWPLVAGLAILGGVIAAQWSVRIGTTLVAVGALGVIAMMPWMIAITLPIGAVAVAGTMLRGRLGEARPGTA